MKKQHNGGFSLVEVLVAMAVLALVVVPACTGMVMSFRMNAKTDERMKAQLAVSSAVEELMAEGIDPEHLPASNSVVEIDVTPKTDGGTPPTIIYYEVCVTSKEDSSITVTTHIRAEPEETTAPTTEPTSSTETGGGAVG